MVFVGIRQRDGYMLKSIFVAVSGKESNGIVKSAASKQLAFRGAGDASTGDRGQVRGLKGDCMQAVLDDLERLGEVFVRDA